MRRRFVVPAVVLATVIVSPLARAQNASPAPVTGTAKAPVHVDGWGRPVAEPPKDHKPGPAPVRDLSGIWEPAEGWRAGVQANGARDNPSDRTHVLPFTPLGEQTWKSHKPGFGTTAVEIQFNNDPFNICDPIGTPRINLFNLRGVQIVQTKKQVLLLYQNSQVWRNIWMDGRELPKEFDEPRWYGYSVGKWTDDYTFVAQTRGLDERTWIDNAGRPHSDELMVEETFHRVNADIVELTLTINDPKMYTQPWVALNKFKLGLLPDSFDIREQLCSPSEAASYNTIQADAVKK
jgi:hypothetical protein